MTEPPAPVIPFKVFGLRRTGTNLMVALLTRNFFVHSLEIGAEWNHGPVDSCFRYFQGSLDADPTVTPQFVTNPSMSFDEFVVTPITE